MAEQRQQKKKRQKPEESAVPSDSPLQRDWCLGPNTLEGNITVIEVGYNINDLMHSLLLGLPRHKFDVAKNSIDLRRELKDYAKKEENEVGKKMRKCLGDAFLLDEFNAGVEDIFVEEMEYYDPEAKNHELQPDTVLPVFAMLFKMRVVLYLEIFDRKQGAAWTTQVYDGREGGLLITQHEFKISVEWRETIGLVLKENHYDLFDHEAWHNNEKQFQPQIWD
jgi:hypothetical protein